MLVLEMCSFEGRDQFLRVIFKSFLPNEPISVPAVQFEHLRVQRIEMVKEVMSK